MSAPWSSLECSLPSRGAPSPPLCLSVWVIGNPTSGGQRGAMMLGRLAKLFQKTYGAEAVEETCSSRFLSLADPASATPPSCASTAVTVATAHHQNTNSNTAHQSAEACATLPSLEAIWKSGVAPSTAAAGPTPNITPPPSPQAEGPSSTSAAVQVRTMLIHTDQSGHAKNVGNTLSRLILHWRLSENPPRRDTPQEGPAVCVNAAFRLPPRTQHLVLVVGGDGTLSEVVNGLCEGTLTGYRHFMSALRGGTTPGTRGETNGRSPRSSHAHVEEEAAVFTHLLPALLYVPGGTGADFAKLGLCCPTPEAALHVVRDGVAKMLFRASDVDSGTARSTRRACYGCPVDVGRIEFLSTGTRHFFINICSIGMSCDVIQRGERFKQSKLVSKLGGMLLFALSAFISLLLMTPKPLYICKLPPRTTPIANVTTEEQETQNVQHSSDSARHYVGRGGGNHLRNGENETPAFEAQQQNSPDALTPQTDALLSLPPFAPAYEQLQRLLSSLPLQERDLDKEQREKVSGTHALSSSHKDNVFVVGHGDSAYRCHTHAQLPPPHSKAVQCTTKTASSEVRQQLDMTEKELQTLRAQQVRLRGQAKPSHPETFSYNSHDDTRLLLQGKEIGSTTGPANADSGLVKDYISRPTNSRSNRDDVTNGRATVSNGTRHPSPLYPPRSSLSGQVVSRVNEGDDDLSALTWVELPSSMVAFANGRWYGGGMHVAPHANPTDGILSCTNWVATVLPFVSGVLSLYTGRHLRWSSTSAFEGERFLVCNAPPPSLHAAAEPLYMEADGEVLESVPAVIELAGKITFLVPSSCQLCLGDPAPGTTRARVDAADSTKGSSTQQQQQQETSLFCFADRAAGAPAKGGRLRRSLSGLGSLGRRTWGYVQRWAERSGRPHNADAKDDSGEEKGRNGYLNRSGGATRRARDGTADEIV